MRKRLGSETQNQKETETDKDRQRERETKTDSNGGRGWGGGESEWKPEEGIRNSKQQRKTGSDGQTGTEKVRIRWGRPVIDQNRENRD